MDRPDPAKRIILNNRLYGWRHALLFLIILIAWNGVAMGARLDILAAIVIPLLAFYAFLWQVKRIQYDARHLYITRLGQETVIPFDNITLVRRSRMRVNRQPLEFIEYTDAQGEAHTYRYVRRPIHDYTPEFRKALRAVNGTAAIY